MADDQAQKPDSEPVEVDDTGSDAGQAGGSRIVRTGPRSFKIQRLGGARTGIASIQDSGVSGFKQDFGAARLAGFDSVPLKADFLSRMPRFELPDAVGASLRDLVTSKFNVPTLLNQPAWLEAVTPVLERLTRTNAAISESGIGRVVESYQPAFDRLAERIQHISPVLPPDLDHPSQAFIPEPIEFDLRVSPVVETLQLLTEAVDRLGQHQQTLIEQNQEQSEQLRQLVGLNANLVKAQESDTRRQEFYFWALLVLTVLGITIQLGAVWLAG